MGAGDQAGTIPYKLVDGRHGRFLANPNDTYVGRALIDFGEYSESECRVLTAIAPEGGNVVEIGANIGAHTVPLARRVGETGVVHAFEPQPIVFQNLCANLALNGLANVRAYNAGCAAEASTLIFPDIDYEQEGNFGALRLAQVAGHDRGQEVAIRTLDSYGLDRIDLLKIDVEGMEQAVIAGARQTIERARPVIYMEFDRSGEPERLMRMLSDLGYRLWRHRPPLFNPENWTGRRTNPWPGVISNNLLAVHRSREAEIDGLPEIDPGRPETFA